MLGKPWYIMTYLYTGQYCLLEDTEPLTLYLLLICTQLEEIPLFFKSWHKCGVLQNVHMCPVKDETP